MKMDRRHIPNAQRVILGLPLMGRPPGIVAKARADAVVIDDRPPEDRLSEQIHEMWRRVVSVLERWREGDR
jgi:hypothetical protein